MRIKNILVAFAVGLCLTLGMVWLFGGLTQVAAAPAAVRLVAPGGADTGDCTAPCATIGYAIGQADVLDTINVATGIYPENVTIGISLTLQGAGAGNTIVDGSGTDRVITVTNDAVVTIDGMTIQNGKASDGGGIHINYGCTVNVNNSTIYNNTADYGGGIRNSGDVLTINNSTVYSNTSQFGGGGIYNEYTLTINNSTISGNTTNDNGGGIYNENESGTSTAINNSTISGNTADDNGGGIFNGSESGTFTITHSTISGNTADGDGGGIYIDYELAAINIKNTIIAGNSDDNCDGHPGEITSQGYNIENTDTCNLDQPSDIVDSATVIPFLGPLQNNGGDTETHALLAGSPAIDTGDPNFVPPPEFDQRGPGFRRVMGGRLDIGAYEYVPPVGGHTEPASVSALLWPWVALAVAVAVGTIGAVMLKRCTA
jgi:hypothetical protein